MYMKMGKPSKTFVCICIIFSIVNFIIFYCNNEHFPEGRTDGFHQALNSFLFKAFSNAVSLCVSYTLWIGSLRVSLCSISSSTLSVSF